MATNLDQPLETAAWEVSGNPSLAGVYAPVDEERTGGSLIAQDVPYFVFGPFARWLAAKCADQDFHDVELLQRAFDAVEILATSEDPRTENLIRTGFLESLIQEEPDALAQARAHYGPRTSILDHEITSYWEEFHKDRPAFEASLDCTCSGGI